MEQGIAEREIGTEQGAHQHVSRRAMMRSAVAIRASASPQPDYDGENRDAPVPTRSFACAGRRRPAIRRTGHARAARPAALHE